MSYLYKYRPVNKKSIEILIKQKLFFAKTIKFNDPFDGRLLPRNFMSELKELGYSVNEDDISKHESFVSDRLNGYGVLSLSRSCKDILMWSHYADSHKGFCLGFKDDLRNFFYDFDCPVRQESVKYENEHPFRNIHKDWISKNRFNSNDVFFDYAEMSVALLDAAITVKHSSWRYEQEERIISEVDGLHSFHAEALDRIVLGMNMSQENEATIISLLGNEQWRHVRLYRAKRGKAALSIDVEPIEDSKSCS